MSGDSEQDGNAGTFFNPPGLNFFDGASNRQMKYVYPDYDHECAGWILFKHRDGQWVTLRKATEDDLERINKAVISAHHADTPPMRLAK